MAGSPFDKQGAPAGLLDALDEQENQKSEEDGANDSGMPESWPSGDSWDMGYGDPNADPDQQNQQAAGMQQEMSGLSEEEFEAVTTEANAYDDESLQSVIPKHLLQIWENVSQEPVANNKNTLMVERGNFEIAWGSPGYSDYNIPDIAPQETRLKDGTHFEMDPLRRRLGKYWSNPKDIGKGYADLFPDTAPGAQPISFFDWPFIFRGELDEAHGKANPDRIKVKQYGLMTDDGSIVDQVHVRKNIDDLLQSANENDVKESLLAWKHFDGGIYGGGTFSSSPGGKHFKTLEILEGMTLEIDLKDNPEFKNLNQINAWLRQSKNAAYAWKSDSFGSIADITEAAFLENGQLEKDLGGITTFIAAVDTSEDIAQYPALAGSAGAGNVEAPINVDNLGGYYDTQTLEQMQDGYVVSIGIESDYPWNKPGDSAENLNLTRADQMPLISPSYKSVDPTYANSEFWLSNQTGDTESIVMTEPPPPSELNILGSDFTLHNFTQENWDTVNKVPGSHGGYMVHWTNPGKYASILNSGDAPSPNVVYEAEFVPLDPTNILGEGQSQNIGQNKVFFDHTFRYNAAISEKFSNGHYVKYTVTNPTWEDPSTPPAVNVHQIGVGSSLVARVTPEYNYFLKSYEQGINRFGNEPGLVPAGARFETALPNPYTRRYIYEDFELSAPLNFGKPLTVPTPGLPLIDATSAYMYKFTTLAYTVPSSLDPKVLEAVIPENVSNTMGGSVGTEYFSTWPDCYDRIKDISLPANFFERKMQNIFFDHTEYDKSQTVVENQPAGLKISGNPFHGSGELVYENTPPELAKKEYYPMGVTVEIPLEENKFLKLPTGEFVDIPMIIGGGAVETLENSNFSMLFNKYNLIVPLMKWVSSQQNYGHNYTKMGDDYINRDQYTDQIPLEWGTPYVGGGHTGPKRSFPPGSPGFFTDLSAFVQSSKIFRNYSTFPIMLPDDIIKTYDLVEEDIGKPGNLGEQIPPTIAGRADLDGNGYKVYDFISWFDHLMDTDVETIDQGGDLSSTVAGGPGRPFTVFSGLTENETNSFTQMYNDGTTAQAMKIFMSMFYDDAMKLIETNKLTRTLKQIFNKEEAYAETLFYAVKKWDIEGEKLEGADHQGPGKLLQTIYVPNYPGKEVFKYFDSQVKYDKRYKYEIYAYKFVVGTEYRYSHVGGVQGQGTMYGGPENDGRVFTNCKKYVAPEEFWPSPEEAVVWLVCNDGPTGDQWVPSNEFEKAEIYTEVKSSPSIKIIEVPYFSVTPDNEHAGYTSVLDDPPLAPDVNILPFHGENDRLMFTLNMNSGQVFQKPVQILPDEQYEKFYESQGFPFGTVIRFSHESDLVGYRIYKTDKKPNSYSDFLNGAFKDLKAEDGGSFIDNNICANKKYYYTFKSFDKHGHFSNPTHVYEVELVDDAGAIYPIINLFEPKYPTPHSKQKNMKKYVYIGLAPGHKGIGQGAKKYHKKYLDNSDEELNKQILASIGSGKQYSVYGKMFKIRIKSKKSGKMFDINIKVDKSGKVYREGTFSPTCATDLEIPVPDGSSIFDQMPEGWYENKSEQTILIGAAKKVAEGTDTTTAESYAESKGAIAGPGQGLIKTEDEDDDEASGQSNTIYKIYE